VSGLRAGGLGMPTVNPTLACLVCKTGRARFRIEALNTGRSAHVCSVKCMVTWGLNYSLHSLGNVQGVLQKLLKGLK
jgi:hypothetical protein